MDERTDKNRGHPYLSLPTGKRTVVWIAAIILLLVSLAIAVLPRALAQPKGGADNQAKQTLPGFKTPRLQQDSTLERLPITKSGQPEFLRYDDRSKVRASKIPSGFHNSKDLLPLFETIVQSIPAPRGDPAGVLQIQVMNLDYSDFLGRIAIGRVFNGTLLRGSDVGISKLSGSPAQAGMLESTRITKL